MSAVVLGDVRWFRRLGSCLGSKKILFLFLFHFLKTVCHHHDITTFDISAVSSCWGQNLTLHYHSVDKRVHMDINRKKNTRFCLSHAGSRTHMHTNRKWRQWWNLSVMSEPETSKDWQMSISPFKTHEHSCLGREMVTETQRDPTDIWN